LREELAGLILQSTFTNIPDVCSELFPWLPVRLLSSIRYDTLSRLPRIKIPTLILHSREDRLVPFSHAQRNFEAANHPKLFWEIAGGHTAVLDSGREDYLRGLEKFLDAYFAPRG